MDMIFDFWLRFGINLAIISFLISMLYWRRKPNRNYAIAMIVGGTLVYVVIQLMMQTEIGLGVGFGIFAIFSLLRFRTVEISLRDMTYLFATITLSLVNAMLLSFDKWEEFVAVNVALVATLMILEVGKFMRYRSSLSLEYDNLELLHSDRRVDLLEDISNRTGITPVRVAISRINVKDRSARLRVWYFEEGD